MEALNREIAEELGFGVVPNIFAYAQSEDLRTALWKAFRHIVLRGRLPRTVKEMMGVLVSRALGARYAAEVHLHALMVQGVEAGLLASLRQGEVPPGLSERVQALLQFALKGAHSLDPALLAPLRAAGLGEEEVQEAVAVVGLFRMVASWTELLEIPVDPL
jgi:alkylhydroperoxidase family enzyme